MSRLLSTNDIDDNSNVISKLNMELPLTKPIHYMQVPARTTSIYPTSEFATVVNGRHKRAIGSLFGINNFGMNITTLQPKTSSSADDNKNKNTAFKSASSSSIVHYHTKQDEMIYILSGTATLVLYDGITNTYEEIVMTSGDVMGFPAGRTVGHSIRNMSTTEPAIIVEVGDRTVNDTAIYPEPSIDLHAKQLPIVNDDKSNNEGGGGQYHFFHKDGLPY